jgi:hypothetical protein
MVLYHELSAFVLSPRRRRYLSLAREPFVAARMNGPLVALMLQPDEDPGAIPPSAITEGDLLIAAAVIVIIGIVLGFDLMRTWWETNRWRRDARRRRRELR